MRIAWMIIVVGLCTGLGCRALAIRDSASHVTKRKLSPSDVHTDRQNRSELVTHRELSELAPSVDLSDHSAQLPHRSPSSLQHAAFTQHGVPLTGPRPATLELGGTQAMIAEPTSDLTLADLEQLALANNPSLAQAAAHVDAARGQWLQVGLPPNPTVGYSGEQLGSHGQAEQQGIFLGQEIVTARKLRLSRAAAEWEIARAEGDFSARRLRVLTDVRLAYYDVLIAQRRIDLAGELVNVSEQAVMAADALFRGEEVSEADPLRARVEADSSRIVLQNVQNQHVAAWRKLTAVVGLPETGPARLVGDLQPSRLDMTWQESLERLLRESPEIATSVADVEAARWLFQRARADAVPNIDVQAVVQHDNGTNGNNANLQVTIPVPLWNRNQGGIQQAEAELVAAQRSSDRLALDLQSRLATVFQRYDSASNQVDKYSRPRGILDNARRTLELVRAGYQSGEFGIIDLLTAQRTYFQTNLAYLDSLSELWASVVEIQGMLLRDSLQD